MKDNITSRKTPFYIFFFVFSLCLNNAVAQQKVTINEHNISLERVFSIIEKQTSYYFGYNTSKVDVNKKVSLSLKNADINESLNVILKDTPYFYEVEQNHIIIRNYEENGIVDLSEILNDPTVTFFEFLPKDVNFHISWKGNRENIKKLYSIIDRNKKGIDGECLYLQVFSYNSSSNSRNENLQSAKKQANNLKSQIIYEKDIKENNFMTASRTSAIKGFGPLVVVRPMKFCNDKLETVYFIPGTDSIGGIDCMSPIPSVVIAKELVKDTIKKELKPSRFNLQTNLLYWAAGVPNIGAEWKINQSVGIILRGAWADWEWSHGNRKYYYWTVNPEVRYYLGESKRWSVGLEGQIGQFDFKFNSKTGRKGNYVGTGLTVGYQLELSKVFNLDFNLGAGYMHISDYEKYGLMDGRYIPKSSSQNKNYWGPTRAGISLIWKFP